MNLIQGWHDIENGISTEPNSRRGNEKKNYVRDCVCRPLRISPLLLWEPLSSTLALTTTWPLVLPD